MFSSLSPTSVEKNSHFDPGEKKTQAPVEPKSKKKKGEIFSSLGPTSVEKKSASNPGRPGRKGTFETLVQPRSKKTVF